MSFDFEIQYRSEAGNKVADALSRKMNVIELSTISIPQWIFWGDLRQEIERNAVINSLKSDLSKGKLHHKFSLHGEFPYYKGRLLIPQKLKNTSAICVEFHSVTAWGILERRKRINKWDWRCIERACDVT
jgi:hypothetical protein